MGLPSIEVTPLHADLVQVLKNVGGFDVDSVRRSTEGARYAVLADAVQRVVQYARALPTFAVPWLPPKLATQTRDLLQRLFSKMSEATKATPASADALRDQLEAMHLEVVTQTAPAFATARLVVGWPEMERAVAASVDAPTLIKSVQDLVTELKSRTSTVLRECRIANDTAISEHGAKVAAATDACTVAVRTATERIERMDIQLGEAALDDEANVFLDDAKAYTRSAWWWLAASAAMGVALLWAVLDAMLWHKVIPAPIPGATGGEALQATAARVLLYATLSSFLLVALRQFSAGRHNAVVNRHRANSLRVYRPLVNVSKDPRVRDLILTHAASSIFSPQPTGLSKGGGEADGASASAILAAVSGREKS